ncbi:acyl-CoA dehydratase activase [Thermodesulfobacteriota bacterium]
MIFTGVDVGARSVNVVILRDGEILFTKALATEEEGAVASQQLVEEALSETNLSFDRLLHIVSTGEGRATVSFANTQRSEQLCHAKGACWLFPSARTVLDVGYEGCRAMKLNEEGKVIDFALNSKCASGSGAFLETMTHVVEMPLEEMATMAAEAEGKAKISSYCTAFAESEVISNIHRGISKEHIVAGIHNSLVDRLVKVLHRVGIMEDVVITGGVARNIGVIKGLEKNLGLKLKVPGEPQIVGALGAALIARNLGKK